MRAKAANHSFEPFGQDAVKGRCEHAAEHETGDGD
jgi:hypothetical protein